MPYAGERARPAFNAGELLRRLMGDRQLAGIIIKGFLQEVPVRLNNLRERLDDGDADGARVQSHVLKGSAATVAAEGLCVIATALENAAATGELDRCGRLLPVAIGEFERFKSTLESAGWL